MDNLITDNNVIVDKSKLNFALKSKVVYKVVDEIWLSTIESILPALDRALRKPTRFIKETDKILPIEQSKNITARSIQDLSAHSNYIKKTKNNKLMPSKILNVFRDETIETYENRFLNTLVNRLFTFVDKRYKDAKLMTVDSQSEVLDVETIININGKNCKAKINIELDGIGGDLGLNENGENASSSSSRIERLRQIASSYLHSQICVDLGADFVRPPIQKTNALLKNPDLRLCLALWEFIEGYNNVGYEAVSKESILSTDDSFIDEMLKTVSYQCATFYNLVHADEYETLVSDEVAFKPKYLTDKIVQDTSIFDLRDTIYNNILSVIDSVAKQESDVNLERESEIQEAMQLTIEKGILEEEKLLKRLKEKERESLKIQGSGLDRSFMSKLIQSNAEVQGYYSQIKNYLSSFKGVKNRLSWKHELFNKGRTKLAYFYFSGRTLSLSLALDPFEFETRIFHQKDLSSVKKYALVPLGLKIKSKLAVRNALKLIDILMARNEIAFENEKNEKYQYAYKNDEKLIRAGLIKVRDSSLFAKDIDDESSDSGFGLNIKYRRSYLSKIIQLDDSKKEYYNIIKNEILSRKKVKSRISWSFETFNLGRNKLAKLVVKGKTLCLCLNLNPSDIDQNKYRHKDVSQTKSLQETPTLIRLRSDRSVKYALELLSMVLDNANAVKFEKAFENFKLPFERDDALIKKGLIKLNETYKKVDDSPKVDDLQEIESETNETIESSSETETEVAKEIESEVAEEVSSEVEVIEEESDLETEKEVRTEIADSTEKEVPQSSEKAEPIKTSKFSLVIDEPIQDEEVQEELIPQDESQKFNSLEGESVERKTLSVEEFFDVKTNVSEYESVFKKYSREEIIEVIKFIRTNTASSVIDQVNGEILIAYKSLCMQNIIMRKKYHKMLTSGDVEKVVFAKDELIKSYFKKIKNRR